MVGNKWYFKADELIIRPKDARRILGDDKQLIVQINEQQYEYLKPKTAQERIHLKFWHPPNRHDDRLYALALACSASTEASPPGKGAIILPHSNS
jgi:hypothetical protein